MLVLAFLDWSDSWVASTMLIQWPLSASYSSCQISRACLLPLWKIRRGIGSLSCPDSPKMWALLSIRVTWLWISRLGGRFSTGWWSHQRAVALPRDPSCCGSTGALDAPQLRMEPPKKSALFELGPMARHSTWILMLGTDVSKTSPLYCSFPVSWFFACDSVTFPKLWMTLFSQLAYDSVKIFTEYFILSYHRMQCNWPDSTYSGRTRF